jgi:hypothetical protein
MTDGSKRWWGDPSRFEDEPLARSAKADFERLVSTGDVDEIVAGLEAVWMLVDRAALWLSSHHIEWTSHASTAAEKACLMMLPTITGQLKAVTALGRADLSYLPTALMAGRSAFEIGLRVAWIYSAEDSGEMEDRALRLHRKTERWMRRVAARLENSETGTGHRWRRAAEAHNARIEQYLVPSNAESALRPPPPVFEQLRSLELERLYHAYQLASEHTHGGLASGGEMVAVRRERSPYGLYWPQDWSLPINLCAWACMFVAQHYPAGDPDVGPVRGLMWAADLLRVAPGPEEVGPPN